VRPEFDAMICRMPQPAGWNFADAWEWVADLRPDALALVHGDRRSTWREFDRRADGVATALLDAGLGHQATVAQYLYNGPEYLESLFGVFKAGLVPVNTNYRYTDDELTYLWDNADIEAVVFHGAFTTRCEAVRHRLRRVGYWLCVDDGTAPCPDWAVPYEDVATGTARRFRPPWGRSGDDLYLLYTGGTTGAPKAVMWRQDDIAMLVGGTTKRRCPGRRVLPRSAG
jgi:acyl-CoA synthetase (AMP-forming)/AMP-acid ligase II